MISHFSKWLRSLRRRFLSVGFSADSIQKIAHDNFLGKRQNSRISYAHIGAVGELPQVFFLGDEMNVGNISVGGLLIIDDNGRLGETVGEMIHLELRWKDISVKQRCRVVGANLQRRHIQFIDNHPVASARLENAVHLGHPGTKFHPVRSIGNVEATEIWMDAAGSTLIFRSASAQEGFAELSYNGRVMHFSIQSWPRIENRDMTFVEISEVLLVLSNFKEPSPQVKF